MLNEISSALSAIRAAHDLATSFNDLSRRYELLSALNKAADEIAAASLKRNSMIDEVNLANARIVELEEEAAKRNKLEAVRESYELRSMPSGMLTYQPRGGSQQGDEAHYLCAACLDCDEVTTLQPVCQGTMTTFVCHRNTSHRFR